MQVKALFEVIRVYAGGDESEIDTLMVVASNEEEAKIASRLYNIPEEWKAGFVTVQTRLLMNGIKCPDSK